MTTQRLPSRLLRAVLACSMVLSLLPLGGWTSSPFSPSPLTERGLGGEVPLRRPFSHAGAEAAGAPAQGDHRGSPLQDMGRAGDADVGVGPRANPPGDPAQGDHRGSPLRDVRLRVEAAETVAVDGDALRLATAVGDVALPLARLVAADPSGEGLALAGEGPGKGGS